MAVGGLLSMVGLKRFVSWGLAPLDATTTDSGGRQLGAPEDASSGGRSWRPPESVVVASNGAPPTALYPWSNPPTAIPRPPRPTPGDSSISGRPGRHSSTPPPTQRWKVNGWCYRQSHRPLGQVAAFRYCPHIRCALGRRMPSSIFRRGEKTVCAARRLWVGGTAISPVRLALQRSSGGYQMVALRQEALPARFTWAHALE